MRQHLTAIDLYVYLRMLRAADSRAFLVVEGESDSLMLSSHIDNEACTIIVGYGKQAVVAAIKLADENGPDLTVGLVDRDFDPVEELEASPNLISTSFYDLEMDVLLQGKALSHVLDACGYPRVHTFLLDSGYDSIEQACISISSVVGMLRFTSVRNRLDLAMEGFPIQHCITDTLTWAMDLERAARLAIHRSEFTGSNEDLVGLVNEELVRVDSVDHLCNSHDFVAAMSLTSSGWSSNRIIVATFTTAIRTALSCARLKSLTVFKRLERWGAERDVTIWACAAEA